MLSVRQKKLSCLQLEQGHTARGLDELYVSNCIGACSMRGAGEHGNDGVGKEERNTIEFGVCVLVEGKEGVKAL